MDGVYRVVREKSGFLVARAAFFDTDSLNGNTKILQTFQMRFLLHLSKVQFCRTIEISGDDGANVVTFHWRA